MGVRNVLNVIKIENSLNLINLTETRLSFQKKTEWKLKLKISKMKLHFHTSEPMLCEIYTDCYFHLVVKSV